MIQRCIHAHAPDVKLALGCGGRQQRDPRPCDCADALIEVLFGQEDQQESCGCGCCRDYKCEDLFATANFVSIAQCKDDTYRHSNSHKYVWLGQKYCAKADCGSDEGSVFPGFPPK